MLKRIICLGLMILILEIGAASGKEREKESVSQKTKIETGEKIGVGDEGEYTTDKTRLRASWREVPKAVEYQYAIGTNPMGEDVLSWTSVGLQKEVEATGLNLKNGNIYYISVKANKKGILFSEWINLGSSDGILVDSTPPSLIAIQDDGKYTSDRTRLSFSFYFEDKESGIAEQYQYALGTSAGGSNVVTWEPTTETSVTESNLSLTHGLIYYFTVKAKNKAGLWSKPVSSDGIEVDTTPPQTPPKPPSDEGEYSSDNTIVFNWKPSSDPESEIDGYWLQVGTPPTGNDLFDKEVGSILTKEITGCEHKKVYYARIKAKNKVGLWSDYSRRSDGIIIDVTPPLVPVVKGEWTTETTVRASWSSIDDESGIIEYQYALGASLGWDNIYEWTSAGEKTEIEITNLKSLLPGQTYYFSLKARNKAGLWSEVGSSDGIKILSSK